MKYLEDSVDDVNWILTLSAQARIQFLRVDTVKIHNGLHWKHHVFHQISKNFQSPTTTRHAHSHIRSKSPISFSESLVNFKFLNETHSKPTQIIPPSETLVIF